MADKTTGELDAVKERAISDLPQVFDLYYDTKIPVEQQGEAMHMTGKQFSDFGKAVVQEFVGTAIDAAERSKKSAEESAASAVSSAESAKRSSDSAAAAKASQDAAKSSETAAKASELAAAGSAQQSADSATLSKSWAVGGTGTRDGEDTNNSKYFSQKSQESANSASNSANAALQSEKNAADSEKNAAASKNAAAQSATNAADSATASANSAASSATSATQSANSAASSKSSAGAADTSAKSAAADAQRAEAAADKAQELSNGCLGFFATPDDLRKAYPTAKNGQWAIVGTTDTIWVWDGDTASWKDSGSNVDMSNYYTKAQVDSTIKTATDSMLPLAGGTMTGDIKRKIGAYTGTPIACYAGDENGAAMVIQMGGETILASGEAGTNLLSALGNNAANNASEKLYLASDNQIYLVTNCQTIGNRVVVTIDNAGKITAPGGFGGGPADTATKLASGRTISVSGDATGTSGAFTGEANATIPVTLATVNSSTSAVGPTGNASPGFGGTFNVPQITANAKGLVTAVNSRTITLPAAPTSVSGNAGTATKLAAARNINGVVFDGSADRANWGSCSTAAGTAAKTVACTGFALVAGAEIVVKFTGGNTAPNPTLSVNGTAATPLYYQGEPVPETMIKPNDTLAFRYNGKQYDLVGGTGGGGTNLEIKVRVKGLAATTVRFTYSGNTVTGSIGADGFVLLDLPQLGLWQMTVTSGSYTFEQEVKVYRYGITEVWALAKKAFIDCTPQEIQAIARSGMAPQYWSLGDRNKITMQDGEEVYVVIAGFDHDVAPDGVTALPLTLVMENCFKQKYKMHSASAVPWTGCDFRTNTLPALMEHFPFEWQNIMAVCQKKTANGVNDAALQTTDDTLFLLSEIEVTGANAYTNAGEGVCYPIFTDNASRVKTCNGTTTKWWNRSPCKTSMSNGLRTYNVIETTGATLGQTAASAQTELGVCLGFCVD